MFGKIKTDGNFANAQLKLCKISAVTIETHLFYRKRSVNMRDFVITTDSNSDLPESYIKENQIVRKAIPCSFMD